MGSQTSDDLIRCLAGEFRVVTLGGVAVIATGLSRNTFDVDIWVEPFSSPDDWAGRLTPLIYDSGGAKPVAIGSWKSIERENLAEVIGRDGVIRINGLERPLDIFRDPNQLEMESFDEVWERSRLMDDGTRLPDAIDLLVSKQDTDRDKDRADIIFLEGKIEADYLERLPAADAAEAEAMLARFLTPRVAQCALDHPDPSVREMGRGFLRELSADGDPYAAEILRLRFPGV